MSVPIAEKRIAEFEKMGFGMFVHFGLYSIIGQGEWYGDAHKDKINEFEYKKLMGKFNPDSMEGIVETAAKAGAKYVTFTTRHHDGFSLYDTCGLSDFDSIHALSGRDLVREFVNACRKYNIVPFFYHTTLDWWHPDFEGNFDKYLEYLRESVKILCTNYGKIGGFWFDGNWSKQGDVWQEDKLYGLIREYQPDAIIINNTGLNAQGETGHPEIDSVTFERGRVVPMNREGMKKYIAAEMCETTNMHWGIARDFNYKSPKQLIETLCDCRRVGANLLLNVGPDSKGVIPALPKATMEVIGKWLKIFGESIYDTTPLWWGKGRNFALKKDENVYIFCYDLGIEGSDNVVFGGIDNRTLVFEEFPFEIEDVCWMDNEKKMTSKYENGRLTINLTQFPYGTDYCVRVAKAKIH